VTRNRRWRLGSCRGGPDAAAATALSPEAQTMAGAKRSAHELAGKAFSWCTRSDRPPGVGPAMAYRVERTQPGQRDDSGIIPNRRRPAGPITEKEQNHESD
jgi:hypothetical protein